MKLNDTNVQPVFVVGHGRSGTIHLADMLDSDDRLKQYKPVNLDGA